MRSLSMLAVALLFALACTSGSARRPAGQPSSESESPREKPLVVAVPEPEAEPTASETAAPAPILTGGSSWTQFHAAAPRRGASPAPPIAKPKLAWKARTGIHGWLNSPIVLGKPHWRFYLGHAARAGATIPAELAPGRQCDWQIPTGHPSYPGSPSPMTELCSPALTKASSTRSATRSPLRRLGCSSCCCVRSAPSCCSGRS
jgi:hypothetical protein